GIAAVLVAMLAALTVLPAVLMLLGRRIDAGRIRRRPRAPRRESGFWARWVRGVMRRPVPVLVGVTAVLVVLAAPFLGVRWGAVDYRVLPGDAPAHQAADTLAAEFGAETSSATVILRGADRPAAAAYQQALSDVDGVEDVVPVAQQGADHLIRVQWTANSQAASSRTVVEGLRAVDPPGAATALVGGLSADTVDLLDSLRAHLPWMAV